MSLMDRLERSDAPHLGFGLSEVRRDTWHMPRSDDEPDAEELALVVPADATQAELTVFANTALKAAGFNVRTGLPKDDNGAEGPYFGWDVDLELAEEEAWMTRGAYRGTEEDDEAPAFLVPESGIDWDEAYQVGLHLGGTILPYLEEGARVRHSSAIGGMIQANGGGRGGKAAVEGVDAFEGPLITDL